MVVKVFTVLTAMGVNNVDNVLTEC